jgi:hypothetical protein
MTIKGTFLLAIISVYTGILPLNNIYLPIKAFAQSEAVLSNIQVRRIGVMPFFKGRYGSTLKDTLDVSVSQVSFNPEIVTADCDRILTGFVQEALQKRHGEQVISLSEFTVVFEQISENKAEYTLRSLAQKTGQALGANLVMVGTVLRFKERVGSALGVQSPASVAFAVGLIETESGKTIWKAAFDKTQRPLSDDIRDARAFFKKGAKWLTANELSHYGIEEIFKKYPL